MLHGENAELVFSFTHCSETYKGVRLALFPAILRASSKNDEEDHSVGRAWNILFSVYQGNVLSKLILQQI